MVNEKKIFESMASGSKTRTQIYDNRNLQLPCVVGRPCMCNSVGDVAFDTVPLCRLLGLDARSVRVSRSLTRRRVCRQVPGSAILLAATRADQLFSEDERQKRAQGALSAAVKHEMATQAAVKKEITRLS